MRGPRFALARLYGNCTMHKFTCSMLSPLQRAAQRPRGRRHRRRCLRARTRPCRDRCRPALLRAIRCGGTGRLCHGRTPRAAKIALATLMKAIRLEGESALVPVPLDERGKPAFAKRGMHFNGWTFGSPYSFRTWTEQEWSWRAIPGSSWTSASGVVCYPLCLDLRIANEQAG